MKHRYLSHPQEIGFETKKKQKKGDRLRVPVNQFACYLSLPGFPVIKLAMGLSCVIQTTAATSRKCSLQLTKKNKMYKKMSDEIDR